MSDSIHGKLNRLLAELGDTTLVSSRWLRSHGYSSSLVARYVGSGWLVSPARGVYMRNGGHLQWSGVVRSLQVSDQLSIYVGGRFALALQGHEHYLRLGEAGTITLYGTGTPGWLHQLALRERFEYCGKSPFDYSLPLLTSDLSDEKLLEQGLTWYESGSGAGALVSSTPERAIVELCESVADATMVYEVDALIQGMATLRPRRVTHMLRHCKSIKAKRLFLALSERHQHAWLSHVSLEDVDLGRGNRALVPGGRLHPTYLITLPRDLDDHLG